MNTQVYVAITGLSGNTSTVDVNFQVTLVQTDGTVSGPHDEAYPIAIGSPTEDFKTLIKQYIISSWPDGDISETLPIDFHIFGAPWV